MNPSSLALTKDLVSPWSFPALILITLFLVIVTVWTYRGVRGSTNRRVGTVLGLRLTALVLAVLMMLSAAVMIVRAALVFAARCMAAPIFRGLCKVTAQVVEPEPLKNAPSAPAFSAAAMTRGKNGTNFVRNG